MTNDAIDLADLMQDKFEEWERVRSQSEIADKSRSADEVLESFLRMTGGNWIYFVGGTGSSGSIQSFKAAYDNNRAWSRYEEELNDEQERIVAALSLENLVFGLSR